MTKRGAPGYSPSPGGSDLLAFARVAATIVERIGNAVAWLVAAVVVLLFAQIPLREFFRAGNGLSNDMGQLAHAAVVVTGIALAMRARAHVRVDLLTQAWSERRRALVELICTTLFVLPWMAAIAWFGWPIVRRGFAVVERFPETFSPGYFLLKGLILALAALVALQAFADMARALATLRERDGR